MLKCRTCALIHVLKLHAHIGNSSICSMFKHHIFIVNYLLQFDSLNKIRRIATPSLFLSGSNDQLVPPSMMYKLYEVCNKFSVGSVPFKISKVI